MGKLMNKGYSKQSAFNVMKGLSKHNSNTYSGGSNTLPYWTKYIVALVLELILIFNKVPSKEDVQIMMLKTIVPLSPATQPFYPVVTILAILMQLFTLYAIYDLIMKIKKGIENKKLR
jgi:hypothetical protein